MSTTLEYAGVKLANVLTHVVESTTVKDRSGTDQIGIDHVIRVDTIINVEAAAEGFGVCGILVPGTSAVDIEKGVRERLLAPRGSLNYSIGGVSLIWCEPKMDLDGGPHPLYCRVKHVTTKTLRIEYAIRVRLQDCHGSTPPGVISNRWSCTDNINEDFTTTRTWRGLLRISNAGTYKLRDFRNLCVPTLQLGYQRTHMNFVESENGLELGWEITDQQMAGDSPPIFCHKWDMTHTEDMGFSAMKNMADFSIRLYGTPRADKWGMLAWASRVLLAKWDVNTSKDNFRVLNLTFVDYSGSNQNSIEVRARIMRVVKSASGSQQITATDVGAAHLKTWGKRLTNFQIPNYNADASFTFGPYGTADQATLAGLFACVLQSPCGGNNSHKVPTGGPPATISGSAPKPGSAKPPQVSASQGSTAGFQIKSPGEPSQEHEEAMYQHCRVQVTLEWDSGYRGQPIAKPKNSASKKTTAIVRLFQPQCKKIIEVEFERIGAWPDVWIPRKFTDAQGIEHFPKTFKPSYQGPQKTSDGHIVYSFDGEYEFIMDRPPDFGQEDVATISLPWDQLTPMDVKFPASNMIDPGDSKNGLG